MATAKKRPLDSISDSQTKAKRYRPTSRCHLRSLPDELLILIAENLAGFDDPVTYVHWSHDNELTIHHPKAYRDVSPVGLRHLSATLSIEFEKALHKNGILTFNHQLAFANYFDPKLLENAQRLAAIRLTTQRVRFIEWSWKYAPLPAMKKALPLLVNLKKAHLGGVRVTGEGELMITPHPNCAKEAAHDFVEVLCSHPLLESETSVAQNVTMGPGRFGCNTMANPYSNRVDAGCTDPVRNADRDDVLTIDNDGQENPKPCPSVRPTDEETKVALAARARAGWFRGRAWIRYQVASRRANAALSTYNFEEYDKARIDENRAFQDYWYPNKKLKTRT